MIAVLVAGFVGGKKKFTQGLACRCASTGRLVIIAFFASAVQLLRLGNAAIQSIDPGPVSRAIARVSVGIGRLDACQNIPRALRIVCPEGGVGPRVIGLRRQPRRHS